MLLFLQCFLNTKVVFIITGLCFDMVMLLVVDFESVFLSFHSFLQEYNRSDCDTGSLEAILL